MPEPHLRAADADRAAVATALGQHMSAGRLSVEEYDERLARAYAAKTYGELDALTADLPSAVRLPGRTRGRPPAAPRRSTGTAAGTPTRNRGGRGDHVADRAHDLGRDLAGQLGVPLLLAGLGDRPVGGGPAGTDPDPRGDGPGRLT